MYLHSPVTDTGRTKATVRARARERAKWARCRRQLARALLVKGFEDGGIVVSNLRNPIGG